MRVANLLKFNGRNRNRKRGKNVGTRNRNRNLGKTARFCNTAWDQLWRLFNFRTPFLVPWDKRDIFLAFGPSFFLPWDLRAIPAFAHTSGVRTLFFYSSMTNFAFAHTSRFSADVDDDIQVYTPRSSSISVDSNWSPHFYKAKSNYFCSGTFAWKKRWDLLGAGIREGM